MIESSLLSILLTFVVVDYISGVLAAGKEGKLNSNVGIWGIPKKVSIFAVVAIAHLIDTALGDAHLFRDAPIFPSVRIAQSGLETGWHINAWHNLVGFKVGSRPPNGYWKGAYVNKGTWEVYDGKRTDVVASFRAYDSIEDCFLDQDELFKLSRYDRVRHAQTSEEQADMLYACGYATDPQYAAKLKSIISQYGLKRYDEEVSKMLQELQARLNEQRDQIEVLERNVQQLKAKASMEVPDWAKEAVDVAVKAGIIDTPDGGSYDFYRILTVMQRVGIVSINDETLKKNSDNI